MDMPEQNVPLPHVLVVLNDEDVRIIYSDTLTHHGYLIQRMVSNLRAKIGAERIETVWGRGYRLVR
jgi:DNA-binding response OmpR family regulator